VKLQELSFLKEDIQLHEETMNLWEMANLRPQITGVKNVIIWVSSGEEVKHGPRIKVVRGRKWKKGEEATVPLTGLPRVIGDINLTQDEFAQIIKWIQLNKKVLMKYWQSELYTDELLDQLERIEDE